MKSETYLSRPFIWYTTWLPLRNFNFLHLLTLPYPLGSAPKYEIRNLLVETFHLIYYMTTSKKLKKIALDDLAPTPRKCPKIWNPKPTRRDLSFDILHDYLLKTLTFLRDALAPYPRKAPNYEIRNLLVETFHLIYYMTTFKNFNFLHVMTLPQPLGSAPKYEIRNLLVETSHLIYYMTTFKNL